MMMNMTLSRAPLSFSGNAGQTHVLCPLLIHVSVAVPAAVLSGAYGPEWIACKKEWCMGIQIEGICVHESRGLEWHSKSFHAVCSKGGLLLLENILQCMECSSLAIKLRQQK